MSLSRINVSLEQYEIGLTGSIPEPEYWSEPAMDRAILEFIALFSGIVFKYGGRIVHGAHPAFMPVILHQARLHAGHRTRKPVTIVMSNLWANTYNAEEIDSIKNIAELVITRKIGEGGVEDVSTRNKSLTAMRKVLINAQNVMVTVGGKLHSHSGAVQGVAEEMQLAEKKGIPRFLIAGLGGAAREQAEKIMPSSLNNCLDDAKNLILFSSNDVASCINLLFEHFVTCNELIDPIVQPAVEICEARTNIKLQNDETE
jgi:hypothetical protein